MSTAASSFSMMDCSRRRRRWLAAAAGVCGFQAMAVQALFLREAVVLMSGSELAWGVVLGAWLLGIAVGGAAAGRFAAYSRSPVAGLSVLLPAVSVAACVSLWAFRGGRGWLGVPPGELLPLTKTLIAAALLVPPASILVGMTFPFLCAAAAGGRASRLPSGVLEGAGSLGRIYAIESAGSLVGGAWISFWAVDHLGPAQTLLLCGALAAAAAAGLLRSDKPEQSRDREGADDPRLARPLPHGRGPVPVGECLLAAASIGALVVTFSGGERINEWLTARRWRCTAPGYDLVAERETRYQSLALALRDGQYTLRCDGQVSASFPDPYAATPPAHLCMCQHPSPRSVLMIGGLAEGLLAEVLLHPVERVDCVEPDSSELELIGPYLDAANQQARHDPRVAVHHQDARHFIKTRHAEYDLVIARLPEPTSAMRARYYTREFYQELRQAVKGGAVVCLTAPAAPTRLSGPGRDYLASRRALLREQFAEVLVTWGDPAFIFAATDAGVISSDPAELARRYGERGVRSEVFSPLWFEGAADMLDAAKIVERSAELDAAGEIEISTDLRPAVYLRRLELIERMMTSPCPPFVRGGDAEPPSAATGGMGEVDRKIGVIAWLRALRLSWVVVALGGMAVATLLLCRWRAGRDGGWNSGAVVLSVGTTGFATMALSIVWLFAFQNLYGYVYARIGWIIALFMAGLAVGSAWSGWWSARTRDAPGMAARRRLIAVDFGQAMLAAGVPIVLTALAKMSGDAGGLAWIEVALSIMVALTGVLCGAAFALAGAVRLAGDERVSTAAGVVVGADHAGACLGALMTGVLLVPVFGTAAAALLLAGMKLMAALVLLLTPGARTARVSLAA